MSEADLQCVTCGKAATLACMFKLRGIKTGQRCGRPLCRRHATGLRLEVLCIVHHNYRPPVAVIEKDVIVPFSFAIPVERQLTATASIPLALPADNPPASRKFNKTSAELAIIVKDMRELVWGLLQEEPRRGRPDRTFQAAMTMLSPVYMPYNAAFIAKALSIRLALVQEFMARMEKYEICVRGAEGDDNGQLFFKCEWPALMSDGWEQIVDGDGDALMKHCLSFILDSLVVDGTLTRSYDPDTKDWMYSVVAL